MKLIPKCFCTGFFFVFFLLSDQNSSFLDNVVMLFGGETNNSIWGPVSFSERITFHNLFLHVNAYVISSNRCSLGTG